MPVLRQPRHALRRADAAEAPARPRPRLAQRDVEPCLGPQVHPQRALRCPEHVAGLDAEPARVDPCDGHEARAHEPFGVSGQRDHRPGAGGVAADAAENDHDAAGGRVGEAPVVALEAHPVAAARIPEGKVRARPAVGLEQGHGAPG
jgi:hypothetical protein